MSLSLVFIWKFVYFSYSKVFQNRPINIKEKFLFYAKIYGLFIFIYIISFNITLYSPKYSIYQAISFVIFMINIPCIHLLPFLIVKLKSTKRTLYGITIIILESVLSIIASPLLIYVTIKNTHNGLIYKLQAFLTNIIFILNIISFILDALVFLGYRFMKFYLFMPNNGKKKVPSKNV